MKHSRLFKNIYRVAELLVLIMLALAVLFVLR
jgi:hypothetical protein